MLATLRSSIRSSLLYASGTSTILRISVSRPLCLISLFTTISRRAVDELLNDLRYLSSHLSVTTLWEPKDWFVLLHRLCDIRGHAEVRAEHLIPTTLSKFMH